MAASDIIIGGEGEAQPTPTPGPVLKIPLELTFPNKPNCFVLVGAGGTGARVASLLPKIVKNEDAVVLIDHDSVEPKNLIRQHFVHEDVGKNKAVVTAARLKRALIPALRNMTVEVIPEKFTSSWYARVPHTFRNRRTIYIGCVDNADARKQIARCIGTQESGHSQIWLDSGNLLRHGQVLIAKMNDRVSVNTSYINSLETLKRRYVGECCQAAGEQYTLLDLAYDGVMLHAPSLLDSSQDAQGPDCAAVILDGQTAAANQMAAAVMFNLLAAIADGLPIVAPYYDFSTVPPLVKSEDWKPGMGVLSRYTAGLTIT